VAFPKMRLRRLRYNSILRDMVQEHRLSPRDFVLPLFVTEGGGQKIPITSMPGVFQMSRDELVKEVKTLSPLKIPGVILFGIPRSKDEKGTQALKKDGVIQEAIRAIKDTTPDVLVITDVCLCEYMSHGHCGVVQKTPKGQWEVMNDATLEILAQMAVSHAEAGADVVAPSDMMDGRVGRLRQALDHHGFSKTPILSYAVKYASSFYGPFREAAASAPQFGDRKSYQMNSANKREAIREACLDLQEEADMLMVKPALPCLDVIQIVRQECDVPVAAYQVSGEYSMIKAAAHQGFLDENQVMMETLLSIKRAGASFILTYFAKQAAQLIMRCE